MLAEKLLQQVEHLDIIVDYQQMAHKKAPQNKVIKPYFKAIPT
jgi:hypothetical protein